VLCAQQNQASAKAASVKSCAFEMGRYSIICLASLPHAVKFADSDCSLSTRAKIWHLARASGAYRVRFLVISALRNSVALGLIRQRRP
jgi:hypothetical protein